VSNSEGNAKGRTVTLHVVSSLDGFIAKKHNGSAGWRVLEASTKPVLEQRSFTKLKLKFCDTLSKRLRSDAPDALIFTTV